MLSGLLEGWGLFASTFVWCFVSGFIPLVNSELYLAGLSTLSTPDAAVPLILGSTCGQMAAKALVYLGGRGVLKLPLKKYEGKLEETRLGMEKYPAGEEAVIFASALIGLPPLYLTSAVAGILKVRFARFFVAGFLGRLGRFAAIVLFSRMVR